MRNSSKHRPSASHPQPVRENWRTVCDRSCKRYAHCHRPCATAQCTLKSHVSSKCWNVFRYASGASEATNKNADQCPHAFRFRTTSAPALPLAIPPPREGASSAAAGQAAQRNKTNLEQRILRGVNKYPLQRVPLAARLAMHAGLLSFLSLCFQTKKDRHLQCFERVALGDS